MINIFYCAAESNGSPYQRRDRERFNQANSNWYVQRHGYKRQDPRHNHCLEPQPHNYTASFMRMPNCKT